MVHPCAACALRFPSTGELRDHIAAEHVRHDAVDAAATPRPMRHRLQPEAFTRGGWVVPDRAAPDTSTS